jgi:hypothetical protein
MKSPRILRVAIFLSAATSIALIAFFTGRQFGEKNHGDTHAAFLINSSADNHAASAQATAAEQAPYENDSPPSSDNDRTEKPVATPSIESTLIAGNAVNADAANRLLERRDFDSVLDKISLQGGADGAEIANIYTTSLAGQLTHSGSRFRLGRMACGASICGAVFTGMAANDQFTEIMELANDSGAKMYSAAVYPVAPTRIGDPLVYRVIFASNPRFNAITVPTPPQPIR